MAFLLALVLSFWTGIEVLVTEKEIDFRFVFASYGHCSIFVGSLSKHAPGKGR